MTRHRKLTLAIFIGLLAFMGVWGAMVYTGRQYDVDAYKQSLAARGEKFEIADLLPPPAPPEQNGADLLNQAVALLAPESAEWTNLPVAMYRVAPGQAMVSFQQPLAPCRDTTNSWENVMALAANDRPAVELLKQEQNFSALDFHLDYQQGADLPLPQLNLLRRCGERLSAQTLCDLRQGDTASATTNICALLALVNGQAEEKILASQILRAAVASFAAADTWELLQSPNVTDAELARLQKNWSRLEYVRAAENATSMGRAINEDTITKMRTSAQYFHHSMGSGLSGISSLSSGNWLETLNGVMGAIRSSYGEWMWRLSWTYSDELRMLQQDQLVLDTLRTAETNGYFDPGYTNLVSQLQDRTTNAPDNMAQYQWMFSSRRQGYGNAIGRVIAAEAGRQLVLAALALKRYQLKYGNYPADLKSLVPEFAAAIPADPMDGQPLRYQRQADGTFALYSIGINGIDDGGNPTGTGARGRAYNPYFNYYWPNIRELDWVWPQPATPTEIQTFYTALGK